jgi:primosomal protein N' (replication factor Y)
MALTAKVAVDNAAAEFDKAYTYLVPESMAHLPLRGCRCTVPFGGGNRKRAGLVLELEEAPERDMRLKPIFAMIDESPPLDEEALFLLGFIREHTFCTWFQALRLLLPPGKASRPINDEKQAMIRLCGEVAPLSLTPKQRAAAAFLEENEPVSLKELCYYAGITRSVADNLVKKGVAEYFDHITPRNPYDVSDMRPEAPPPLSPAQAETLAGLCASYDSGTAKPALLYGVTGSGKTEVFLRLIAHVLDSGKGAIALVPEISLTAQALEGFHRRFGKRVAVLHSGLSLGERADEWKRIREGGADIVVGTRSAVFAPVRGLGLIVMDEEQERSYKSDKTPRFHARDIALARCKRSGAMLLLSSATPSVESYHAAKSGKYGLFALEKRFNQGPLPEVTVVDMREKQNVSSRPAFSFQLIDALQDNLNKGEQSILLLNRRGHSTLVRCADCGAVSSCPNCTVALTYHAANGSLVCHYCGHARRLDEDAKCGACGGPLSRYAGLGTQRLEEHLRELFPEARILRVDADSTMSRFSHEKLFGAFAAREYDIMVGTQMVAKGLNFPAVTLVGVLQAEQSLYSGDFRAFERTFSLLTQVVGRGGRGMAVGEARALVQSYAPDEQCVRLAAEQSYPAFFAQEIKLRRLHLYPPFCALCGLGFSGEGEGDVLAAAEKFAAGFKQLAASEYADLPLRLLGPAPAEIRKVAGKYRYRLLVKCRNDARTREMLRALQLRFLKETKRIGLAIDMNYDS